VRRTTVLWLSAVVMLSVSVCLAAELTDADSTPLFPVPTKDKMGFIDRQGKLVIEPRFNYVRGFREGLAAARDPGKPPTEARWGFIDRSGAFVIEPQFQEAEDFSDGLARVRQGAYGYIDQTGAMAIAPRFDEARSFSEGLAGVTFAGSGDPRRIAYLDKSGKIAFELRGYDMGEFRDGLAPVNTNMEFGVGKNNVPIIRGFWGFVDTTGKKVIPAKYSEAENFSEGLAAVNVDSVFVPKWGFIDRTGKMIIKPQFTGVMPFRDGLAEINVGYEVRSQQTGPGDFAVVMELGKPGYVDATGRIVWKPQG